MFDWEITNNQYPETDLIIIINLIISIEETIGILRKQEIKIKTNAKQFHCQILLWNHQYIKVLKVTDDVRLKFEAS